MAGPDSDKLRSELNTLISISRELGGTLELDVLLANIGQAAQELLDCERISVLIYDRDTDELYTRLSTDGTDIRFPADRGIAGETVRTGATINVPDAYADSRFNPEVDKSTGFRTRNVLSLAMDGYDGKLIGLLQFLNKRRGVFDEPDERLACSFGALAGVAIQRQLLLEESAQRQKMERDLDVARTIQKSFLPDSNPEIDGYDIVGWNQPADETGGDSYDFIQLEQRKLGLLISDASGHGIGPALVVAECRALIRGLATMTMDLRQIIREANSVLVEDLGDGRFVTACLAVLDGESGAVNYVSAGHAPSLRYVYNASIFFDVGINVLWGKKRTSNIRDLCADQTLGCLGDPTRWQDGNWQTLNAPLDRKAEAPFWSRESFADKFMRNRDEFWVGVTYQF